MGQCILLAHSAAWAFSLRGALDLPVRCTEDSRSRGQQHPGPWAPSGHHIWVGRVGTFYEALCEPQSIWQGLPTDPRTPHGWGPHMRPVWRSKVEQAPASSLHPPPTPRLLPQPEPCCLWPGQRQPDVVLGTVPGLQAGLTGPCNGTDGVTLQPRSACLLQNNGPVHAEHHMSYCDFHRKGSPGGSAGSREPGVLASATCGLPQPASAPTPGWATQPAGVGT